MKQSILIAALALVGLSCASNATHSPAGWSAGIATLPATQPLAALTVRVIDLRNRNGQILFAVFKSADGFPKDRAKSVDWQVKSADADPIVFSSSLPPGRYAASVLHDENKNFKMDMNFLGVPEEGYGVTNNPKPAYRQARFDETTFDLPAGGATLTISIQYF